MTNLVTFPGLGLSFEVNRVAFTIGGMNIYWYGVLIATGIVLAILFAFRHCAEFGIDGDAMTDVIVVGVVMAIICARIYYVAMWRHHRGGGLWRPGLQMAQGAGAAHV